AHGHNIAGAPPGRTYEHDGARLQQTADLGHGKVALGKGSHVSARSRAAIGMAACALRGGTTSKERCRRLPQRGLPNHLEMGAARLDLLRQGVDVAEAALEPTARENRIHSGSPVGEISYFNGSMDGVNAGKPHTRAVRQADRFDRIGTLIDRR